MITGHFILIQYCVQHFLTYYILHGLLLHDVKEIMCILLWANHIVILHDTHIILLEAAHILLITSFYTVPVLFYCKLLSFLLSRHSTRYRYYSTASYSHSLNGTHDSLRPPHYTPIYTVPIFFYCKLLSRLKKNDFTLLRNFSFFLYQFLVKMSNIT